LIEHVLNDNKSLNGDNVYNFLIDEKE